MTRDLASAAGIARRATRGAMIYGLRLLGTQVLQVASALILARALVPSAYGVFAVSLSLVGAARFFADLGAMYYLIVQPELDLEDLAADTTLGLAVAAVSCAVLLVAGPVATHLLHAPGGTQYMAPILGLTLLINAFRFASLVQLERSLSFGRLGLVAVSEAVTIYGLQTALLVAGAGVWALVVGQVAGAAVGTVAAARSAGGLVMPRRTGRVRSLARRGLPFQGTLIATGCVGMTLPLVVAGFLGARGVGLWSWSTTLVAPIIALMGVVHSVSTPSLSRLRTVAGDRTADAEQLLLRVVLMIAGVGAGVAIGLVPEAVILLFGRRWQDAVVAVQITLVGLLPLAGTWVFASVIESQGRGGQRFRATLLSGVVALIAAVPLCAAWGVSGAAAASGVVLPLLDAIWLYRYARVPAARGILQALVLFAVLAAASFGAGRIVADILGLVASAAACLAVAGAGMWLLDRGLMRAVIAFGRA